MRLTKEQQDIVTHNMGLVSGFMHWISPKIHVPPSVFNDIRQEVSIALIKAVHNYDASKGKLATLFWLCAQRTVYNFLEKYNRESKRNTIVDVQDNYGNVCNITSMLVDTSDTNHKHRCWDVVYGYWHDLMDDAGVSSVDKAIVLEYYFNGNDSPTIARVYGVSKQRIGQRRARALNKLQIYMDRHDININNFYTEDPL